MSTGGGYWRIYSKCLGVILGTVWGCLFCDYVLLTMAVPIFPLLQASDLATGVLFSAKALCQICCVPLFRHMIDRHCKGMILLGLSLEIISLLIFAFTHAYGIWMLARALSGVASAALIAAGFAQLQRHFTVHDERATAMGLATTGIIAGVCLGPVLGGTLYEVHASLPFVSVAACELFLWLAAWTWLPEDQPDAKKALSKDEVSMFTMVTTPAIGKVLVALTLSNAVIGCNESTTARYFMNTFGFSVSQVSFFYLLSSVPSCLLSGLIGPLASSVGTEHVMAGGLLLQGIFAALGPKNNLRVEIVSFFMMGAGVGCVDGVAPALLAKTADELFGGSGKVYLMSNVAVQLGFILGPIVGNILIETGGYAVCMAFLGAALVLYAPLYAYVRCDWTTSSSVTEPLVSA